MKGNIEPTCMPVWMKKLGVSSLSFELVPELGFIVEVNYSYEDTC